MIIRHAEKPNSRRRGVDEAGYKDPHDLIVRGWQRAGALVPFFAPSHGPPQSPHIAVPTFLYACSSAFSDGKVGSKSHRARETLAPLAFKLNLNIDLTYDLGDEAGIATAAKRSSGPVLIAWDHHRIAHLAKHFVDRSVIPEWPDDRFDLVYTLTPQGTSGAFTFMPIPQLLLGGDRDTVPTL